MFKAFITLFATFFINATAAPVTESTATQQEIAHLFKMLETAKCQFYRNGSWHSAKEASVHLSTKYKYLQDKGLVTTAEQFIERAATGSSLSGKAYQIKCSDSVAQSSAPWFQLALNNYRSGSLAK